jgi:hypothetical protein
MDDFLTKFVPDGTLLVMGCGLLLGLFTALNTSQPLSNLALQWLTEEKPKNRFDEQFHLIKSILFGESFFSWKRFAAIALVYSVVFLILVVANATPSLPQDTYFTKIQNYSGVYFLIWHLSPIFALEILTTSYVIAFLTFSVSEKWLWGVRTGNNSQGLLRFCGCVIFALAVVVLFYIVLVIITRGSFDDELKSGSFLSFIWRILKITASVPWCEEGRSYDAWVQYRCDHEGDDLSIHDDLWWLSLVIAPLLLTSVMFATVVFISPIVNVLYVAALGLGRCHIFLYNVWGYRQDSILANPVLYVGVVLTVAFVFLFAVWIAFQSLV